MTSRSTNTNPVIIPIDERGRLNASRFTDGPVKISEFHSTLAQEMEEHIASLRQMESSLQHKIKILKETEQHMTQSLQWLDQENLEEIQMKLIKYEELCKKMEFLQQNYPELSEELEQIFSKAENAFSQEIQSNDKTSHNPWRS